MGWRAQVGSGGERLDFKASSEPTEGCDQLTLFSTRRATSHLITLQVKWPILQRRTCHREFTSSAAKEGSLSSDRESRFLPRNVPHDTCWLTDGTVPGIFLTVVFFLFLAVPV